jgi:hypothetical protein
MHKLAEHFASDKSVKIAKMDCGKNLSFCKELNAKIFPLFNVYKNNGLLKRDYHETMTYEGFRECIEASRRGGDCKFNRNSIKSIILSILLLLFLVFKAWTLREKMKKKLRKQKELSELHKENEERKSRLRKELMKGK